MKRLFAYTSHFIHSFHFVSVFWFVVSEPLKGGVKSFFFKSTPNSSFPRSINLFKKSISSCLRPRAASNSWILFSCSFVLYDSLSICTTITFDDCKCREYFLSQA